MSAMSDYLENKMIDFLFRGQSFTPPSTLYLGLFTSSESDAGGGTEISGNNYSRMPVTAALSTFAGTQGVGTTAASSGTSGTTSNNNSITFPTPSANWGTITSWGIFDSASGGNLLWWGALTISKFLNQGDTVTFPAGAFSLQIDN